jgi:hypothetical protein
LAEFINVNNPVARKGINDQTPIIQWRYFEGVDITTEDVVIIPYNRLNKR